MALAKIDADREAERQEQMELDRAAEREMSAYRRGR
jgi:hypothetical protein